MENDDIDLEAPLIASVEEEAVQISDSLSLLVRRSAHNTDSTSFEVCAHKMRVLSRLSHLVGRSAMCCLLIPVLPKKTRKSHEHTLVLDLVCVSTELILNLAG